MPTTNFHLYYKQSKCFFRSMPTNLYLVHRYNKLVLVLILITPIQFACKLTDRVVSALVESKNNYSQLVTNSLCLSCNDHHIVLSILFSNSIMFFSICLVKDHISSDEFNSYYAVRVKKYFIN